MDFMWKVRQAIIFYRKQCRLAIKKNCLQSNENEHFKKEEELFIINFSLCVVRFNPTL